MSYSHFPGVFSGQNILYCRPVQVHGVLDTLGWGGNDLVRSLSIKQILEHLVRFHKGVTCACKRVRVRVSEREY